MDASPALQPSMCFPDRPGELQAHWQEGRVAPSPKQKHNMVYRLIWLLSKAKQEHQLWPNPAESAKRQPAVLYKVASVRQMNR